VLAMRSGRFRYRLGLGGTVLDYEDVPMVGGGTLNNDDRDRFRTDIFARASMDLGPSYRIFLRGAYDQNDFDAALDDTGLNRDSSGYSVVSGLEYDAGGLWFARGYAGWREQRFEDSTLSSVSGFVFGGEVTANITPLTTVSAAADRDIVDTAQAGSSSFWNNTAQLRADHELLRSLIISAALRSRVDQFRGIDRTDRHLGGGVAFGQFNNLSCRVVDISQPCQCAGSLVGQLIITECIDQWLHIIAADHGAENFHGVPLADQGRAGFAGQNPAQEIGLDFGGRINARRDPLLEQFQQKFFLAGRRRLQQLAQFFGLLGVQRQGGNTLRISLLLMAQISINHVILLIRDFWAEDGRSSFFTVQGIGDKNRPPDKKRSAGREHCILYTIFMNGSMFKPAEKSNLPASVFCFFLGCFCFQ